MSKRNRDNETHIMCDVATKEMLKEIAKHEERNLKTTLGRLVRLAHEKMKNEK